MYLTSSKQKKVLMPRACPKAKLVGSNISSIPDWYTGGGGIQEVGGDTGGGGMVTYPSLYLTGRGRREFNGFAKKDH